MLTRTIRPARTDNFNLSIQRELSSERRCSRSATSAASSAMNGSSMNLDAVPYMTTLGGQSFAQAFAQTYFAVSAARQHA